MHGYLLVLFMAFFRPTILTFYWCVGFWTLVRFTYNTRGVTLVFFLVVIMFKTGLAKIVTTEEASDARDGVIMFVIYEVHVDTSRSSLLGLVMNLFPSLALTTITRTPSTSSKASITFRLAGLSLGTPAI